VPKLAIQPGTLTTSLQRSAAANTHCISTATECAFWLLLLLLLLLLLHC
jgi:hypothetical protein